MTTAPAIVTRPRHLLPPEFRSPVEVIPTTDERQWAAVPEPYDPTPDFPRGVVIAIQALAVGVFVGLVSLLAVVVA